MNKQASHEVSVYTIQGSCWLIGDEHSHSGDDSAGYRDPLRLAT
nr:hypothetical protein [Yimella sp. cx-51]